jgi:hypothetical protein
MSGKQIIGTNKPDLVENGEIRKIANVNLSNLSNSGVKLQDEQHFILKPCDGNFSEVTSYGDNWEDRGLVYVKNPGYDTVINELNSFVREKKLMSDYAFKISIIASSSKVVNNSESGKFMEKALIEENKRFKENRISYSLKIKLNCGEKDTNGNPSKTTSSLLESRKELEKELEKAYNKYKLDEDLQALNFKRNNARIIENSMIAKNNLMGELSKQKNNIEKIFYKVIDNETEAIKSLINVLDKSLENFKDKNGSKGYTFKVAINIKRCCTPIEFKFTKEVYDSDDFKDKMRDVIEKYGGKIIDGFGKRRRRSNKKRKSNKRKSNKRKSNKRKSNKRKSNKRKSKNNLYINYK